MTISTTPGVNDYSQYRTKPKSVLWQNILDTLVDDNITTSLVDLSASYDIDSNSGEQLNVIGRVVVQSRVVRFPVDMTDMVEAGDDDDEFGDDSAEFSALTYDSSVTLTDDEYRGMLKSKIQRNNTSATIDEIMTAVNTVLSSAQVVSLNDNGDMTFDLDIIGTLTTTEISLLDSAGFVPRPQCVMFGGYNTLTFITGTSTPTLDDMVSDASGTVNAVPPVTGSIAETLEDSTMVAIGNDGTLDFWEPQGTYPGLVPYYVETNSHTNDTIVSQFAIGNDYDFYNLTGGALPYVVLPSLTTLVGTMTSFAVDSSSGPRGGDLWVVLSNVTDIMHLPSGAAAWTAVTGYPGTNPTAVAINSTNGDLWVADFPDDAAYKRDGTTGVWGSAVTIDSTGGIDDIDVDDVNGDVWILTSGGTSDRQFEVLAGGVGSAFTVHETVLGLELVDFFSLDPVTKDLWIVDHKFGSGGQVFKQSAGAGAWVEQGPRSWNAPGGISFNPKDGSTWVADGADEILFKHT